MPPRRGGAGPSRWPRAADSAARAAATVHRIAQELAGSGALVNAVVRTGNVADEILAQCRAQGADLIVMRTHGRAGLGRAVLGSVTEHVRAASEVPVLL
jgi:nucleotide-binding universal stress UspA family protein